MQIYKFGIVITGNIGSGKSTACELLRESGFSVIDADEINHQILNKSTTQIVQIFGSEFVKDGLVDRKKLGNLVFSNTVELKKLEKFLHPKIKAEILRLSDELEKKCKPYFIDVPLFFERQSYNEFDKILVIYAPKERLIKRVMKRNLLTKDDVLKRLNLQLDIEKKRNLANFVIDNSGNLADLKVEVGKFLENLKETYADIEV